MFDEYHHHEHHTAQTVKIEEKRAPTDESVRLLKEMEKAAADKITESVRVSDNGFECVIHHHVDYLQAQDRLLAVFSLNGRKMKVNYDANPLKDSPESALVGLRDAVAAEIANQIAGAFAKAKIKLNYTK